MIGYNQPVIKYRKLSSDPLSLDFGKSPDLLYVGMRNSSVVCADLRTPWIQPNVVCRVPGGKAVVGVKRLDDAAVPYGLVASAMGHEVGHTICIIWEVDY